MTPEPLIDDPTLEISWLKGRGDRMVVSFTGIGPKDQPDQRIEFPRLAAQQGENTVVFVTDRLRSWYNEPGMVERITETVLSLAGRLGTREIVTLGNSMGGYGAVLFANRLGARHAISFVPQFTMDDRVLRESRWQDYKARIGSFAVSSLRDSMAPPTQFFVLHGGKGRDRKHYLRFPTGPHIEHYILPLKTHSAATLMHVSGELRPLVAALLAGNQAGVADLMRAQRAHLRDRSRACEDLHLWAAGRRTRLGHRLATWFAALMSGTAGQKESMA